ncbi:MAG: hypothetical protein NZ518_00825 [Dehalococcoidia bacterium]|nr:hypothetical protein [Dehalococcoidia bacterium]
MRLLMVVFPEAAETDVRQVIEQSGVPGWTQVRNLVGSGVSGPHLGTPIWPGHNAAFFTAVPDDVVGAVVTGLKAYVDAHQGAYGRAIPIRVFAMPCEQLM